VRQGILYPLTSFIPLPLHFGIRINERSNKNDTSINGMEINNSEYLLSQYADNSSLILDGGMTRLQNLYIF
jgi:hypothetical protein